MFLPRLLGNDVGPDVQRAFWSLDALLASFCTSREHCPWAVVHIGATIAVIASKDPGIRSIIYSAAPFEPRVSDVGEVRIVATPRAIPENNSGRASQTKLVQTVSTR